MTRTTGAAWLPGMHSYEVAFDNFAVPAANLIGEAGRGFLSPDDGVRELAPPDSGRAVGVMQSAYEAALVIARRLLDEA